MSGILDPPSREELAVIPGPVILEFGAIWCGYCRAFAPTLQRLLEEFPQVRHVKVEDGPGKPLGRSFRVTLWPTLIFMRDGVVCDKLVRPDGAKTRQGLVAVTTNGSRAQPDDGLRSTGRS